MNILFLDAYYEPEKIAYTHLEKDLVEGLVNSGHNVSIICPIPTRGISKEIKDTYKSIKRETKYDGKVNITRFWAPQEGKNVIIRAFRYFWCNLRTYQLAVKYRNVDAVFSNSTPPTQGFLGGLVAKRLSKKHQKHVPFIYNLQDIFPDSLVNANLTHKNSLIWRLGSAIEKCTYDNSEKIILISQGFKDNLIRKGVDDNKIVVISNWIDLDDVIPVAREQNKIFDEYGISREKFIVLYAGNFGEVQGAEIVIKAAEVLKQDENIHFVIFGGGANFEKCRDEANKLKNVTINSLLPSNRISEVYSLADVAIITCKKGTGNSGMPSKLWSILACNTRVVASFDYDSDLVRCIFDSKSGSQVEPENLEALVAEISIRSKTKRDDSDDFRSYVLEYADKKKCVEKYISVINGVR